MSRDKAEKLGLGYAMRDGGGCETTEVFNGPLGAGVFFSFAGANTQLGNGAVWREIPGKGGLSVGYLPEKKPKPRDLERANMLSGHATQLGDGHKWLIPCARRIDGSTPLERGIEWDGSSWVGGDVVAHQQELYAQACKVWDSIMRSIDGADAEEDVRLKVNDECDIASMALGTNYLLGPAEISLLGLLTTHKMAQVCLALVDWPALDELKKKEEQGEPTPKPGPSEPAPITTQPLRS